MTKQGNKDLQSLLRRRYAGCYEAQLPAYSMSTHAIKTEWLSLLRELEPAKIWHKNPKLVDLPAIPAVSGYR